VILRKTAYAHHAVQRTRGLVTVALTEFTIAYGQFAIRMQAGIKDLHMAWAVHGLKAICTALGFRRKHIFGVIIPVPGFLPKRQIEYLRRLHFLVTVVLVYSTHVL